jgi:hypothetical protein
MYKRALADVLDHIFEWIINGILDLPDITTEESKHLHGALSLFFSFDSRFDAKEESIRPIFLKKFKFTVDILEMNMATIMLHFDRGDLIDFSHNELEHLICALFADTPLRKKNLDLIASQLKE